MDSPNRELLEYLLKCRQALQEALNRANVLQYWQMAHVLKLKGKHYESMASKYEEFLALMMDIDLFVDGLHYRRLTGTQADKKK